MERLQKKCLLVSIGLHLLLMSLLVVGPAFLAPKTKPPVVLPPIDFIPVLSVEAALAGGGNPNVNSAPPGPQLQPPAPPAQPRPVLPPAPAPKPRVTKPPPEPEPEPVQPVAPKNDEPDPNNLELKQEKKHKIVVSTNLVKADTAKDSKEKERQEKLERQKERERARARAEAEARAEEARAEEAAAAARAAWRRGLSSALEHSSRVVGNGLSPGGTSVELRGPGGGGLPYAGFLQAVQLAYDRAWVVPDGVSNEAVAVASVTIARDGTVLNAYITRRSGNREADRSVQAALDRVKTIGVPLPATARENQRTVEVVFSVKSKRMLG